MKGTFSWLAAGLAVTVAGASLGTVARARSDDGGLVPRVTAPAIDVAPSGMVVTLVSAAASGQPVAAGVEQAFYVEVLGTEPVAAVELWVGDGPVAREVLAGDAVEHATRLAWTPVDAPGAVIVVARALDTEGSEAQSNPVALHVVDPEPVVAYVPVVAQAGDTLEAVAQRAAIDVEAIRVLNPSVRNGTIPAGVELIVPTIPTGPLPLPVDAPASTARGEDAERLTLPPLPDGIERMTPLGLHVEADECGAAGRASGDDLAGDVVLWEIGPEGDAMVPVAAMDVEGEPVRVAIGAGEHTFVASYSVDGVTRSWSALTAVAGAAECAPGWSGEVRLLDGVVPVVDSDVDRAYLYVSWVPGRWVRVPETGFVARTEAGFDFSEHLPVMPEGFRLEAWGWEGGELVHIGNGAFTPPPAEPGLAVIDGLPEIGLRWYGPKTAPGLQVLSAGGEIENLEGKWGRQRFRWSTRLDGVTGILVQVSDTSFPPGAGPHVGGLVLQHTLANPGTAGDFAIDFDSLEVIDLRSGRHYVSNLASSGPLDAGPSYGDLVVLDKSSFGPPPTASEVKPDLDPFDDFDAVPRTRYVVRVVPMVSDHYLGVGSNEVALTLDSTPDAEPNQASYELDVDLTKPPTPPDPLYVTCWQFQGWTDDAAVAAALAAEDAAIVLDPAANNPYSNVSASTIQRLLRFKYPYHFWTWFLAEVGADTPICGGCWTIEGHRVSLAGGKCHDSGFFEAVIGAVKQIVNNLSAAYAAVKQTVITNVVKFSGCEELGDTVADACETVATVALDAALVAVGVPPSLPNWEQLASLAEGEIAAVGTAMLVGTGIPCDEATAFASFHGKEEFTCEGAIKAMLEAGKEQVADLQRDTANAMGFGFPALMKVVPHPAGQVGPGEVKLTVSPTRFSASAGGTTCSTSVASASSWTAKPLPPSEIGEPHPPLGPSDVVIDDGPLLVGEGRALLVLPQQEFTGTTFDKTWVRLPDLPFDPAHPFRYAPASKTYQLYPPTDWPAVSVDHFTTGSAVVWPRSHPYHSFLLRVGAELRLDFLAPCTDYEWRTWRLLGGFGAPEVAGS